MAACVGMVPPVTKRKGGRGSSSKLVRLTAVSTALVRGSMTLSVLESSLQIKTRSSACVAVAAGDWAMAGPMAADAARLAAEASKNDRRVNVMRRVSAGLIGGRELRG